MDYTTCQGLNPRCFVFGKTGPYAQLKPYDWQRAGRRFQCGACGLLSRPALARAYAGVRTDLDIYRRGAKALAEGLSIRATDGWWKWIKTRSITGCRSWGVTVKA